MVGKKGWKRAGEIAQWLSAVAALTKDLGWIPSTQKVAHSHSLLLFQGIQSPLLTSSGTRHIHGAHTYIQAKIHTHKKYKN